MPIQLTQQEQKTLNKCLTHFLNLEVGQVQPSNEDDQHFMLVVWDGAEPLTPAESVFLKYLQICRGKGNSVKTTAETKPSAQKANTAPAVNAPKMVPFDKKSIYPPKNKTEKKRITHCYNCLSHLESVHQKKCQLCGWLVCNHCGSCGCQYLKDKDVSDDEDAWRVAEADSIYGGSEPYNFYEDEDEDEDEDDYLEHLGRQHLEDYSEYDERDSPMYQLEEDEKDAMDYEREWFEQYKWDD